MSQVQFLIKWFGVDCAVAGVTGYSGEMTSYKTRVMTFLTGSRMNVAGPCCRRAFT